MKRTWERCIPAFDVSLIRPSFFFLAGCALVASLLAVYREIAGLAPTSGMNDAYAWGIWKTFNIMAVTGLGSGGFAVAIAVWILGRHRLHVVLRTAVMSSLMIYGSGLVLLGVDVGRPWNFYSIMFPWRWNAHSPMLEIAFCMPFYVAVPLLLEATPAVVEWCRARWPQYEIVCDIIEAILMRFAPLILGLGILLPAMHQSSLGALMLLAGTEVNPLWQTPFLPLLYVVAAGFMGFATVILILFAAHFAWYRSIDTEVIGEMSGLAAWLIAIWFAIRFLDLAIRGVLIKALALDFATLLFSIETFSLLLALALFARARHNSSLRAAFSGSMLAALGGLLYRFDPTTLVFRPDAQAFYFPSPIELAICVGFLVAARSLAILPGSLELWHEMEWTRQTSRRDSAPQPTPTEYAAAD
jgi:Ni/Fe-hydrogenase subunit HybB-like protein